MRLCVIIYTKNSMENLCTLLDDLKYQTEKISEICIIDDGSTDDTRFRVHPKLSPVIKYYLQGEFGEKTALEKGLFLSSGDVFLFCSTNIKLFPNTVENLCRFLWKENFGACTGKGNHDLPFFLSTRWMVHNLGIFERNCSLADFLLDISLMGYQVYEISDPLFIRI